MGPSLRVPSGSQCSGHSALLVLPHIQLYLPLGLCPWRNFCLECFPLRSLSGWFPLITDVLVQLLSPQRSFSHRLYWKLSPTPSLSYLHHWSLSVQNYLVTYLFFSLSESSTRKEPRWKQGFYICLVYALSLLLLHRVDAQKNHKKPKQKQNFWVNSILPISVSF